MRVTEIFVQVHYKTEGSDEPKIVSTPRYVRHPDGVPIDVRSVILNGAVDCLDEMRARQVTVDTAARAYAIPATGEVPMQVTGRIVADRQG